MKSLKRFPLLYSVLHTLKRKTAPLWREIAFTARMILSGRIWVYGRNRQLARELPQQKIITYSLALPPFPHIAALESWLAANQIRYEAGAFCIYVPPQPQSGPFDALLSRYPANAGLKILKDLQAPAQAKYVSKKVHPQTTTVSDALAFRPTDFLRVANYLYHEGLGPQVYDLVEIRTAHNAFSAYVMQHIAGETPTATEYAEFIAKVEKLSMDQLVPPPDWKSAKDFRAPDCNHNLVRDAMTGKVFYIDFQTFKLRDAKQHIHRTASEIRKAVHFGNPHLIQGGKYLYQSIPGIRLGKRDTSSRWDSFKQLLSKASVPIEGAVVFDIGCNAGMILYSALLDGAFWAIGWDRPALAAGATQLLLSLGMTRFDILGETISADTQFSLPSHICSDVDGILFFLAMRKHIGFPEGVRRLPFKWMIYEGHEGETLSDARQHTVPLVDAWGLQVVASTAYMTGETQKERPVLLLCRA